MDYILCKAANCSSYSDQIVPGSWENISPVSLNLDPDGFPRMFAMDTNKRVNHIRPVQTFNVQYRSYIPADHVVGPTACFYGLLPAWYLIYKGDPSGTFRTQQSLQLVPDLQVSYDYKPNTGETRNYGFGSPVNRSTLSYLDEDPTQYDCLLWNDKDQAPTTGFSYAVSFPQAHQAHVHYAGSAANPLEKVGEWFGAFISWDVQTVIDTTNPKSPTATITYSHTCYPAHQVTVNGDVVYSYLPPSNSTIYITGCLMGLGTVHNEIGPITVPTY